jgi:hypothetical protein
MTTQSLMILIAGPYRSGTGDDPERLAGNVRAMEAFAVPLFRAGDRTANSTLPLLTERSGACDEKRGAPASPRHVASSSRPSSSMPLLSRTSASSSPDMVASSQGQSGRHNALGGPDARRCVQRASRSSASRSSRANRRSSENGTVAAARAQVDPLARRSWRVNPFSLGYVGQVGNPRS